MNVFEDLVVELQQENLLESTVIDDEKLGNGHSAMDEPDTPALPDDEIVAIDEVDDVRDAEPAEAAVVLDGGTDEGSEAAPPAGQPEVTPLRLKQKNSSEFFKKKAVDEVASLQMVEHVLTGVEREYQKVLPKAFDDFNTKRALHSFLQVAADVNAEEHAKAEFVLLQETEAWCTALGERDRKIMVSSLRQYCENSRPALSSQAMLAIARFYRNLPYSESVRGKFDFVITRLFSRAAPREMRQLLFNREEMLGHLNTLYADWSSIPLYAADEEDSNVMLTALSFEDLCVEAESVISFDQLLSTDFFGRLRLFKESIAELFFAPIVTAAAIECNVRVGNAYVNLIDREREKMDEESIQAKYADLNDQDVSNAASRTLDLVEILRAKADYHVPEVDVDEIAESGDDAYLDDAAPRHREKQKAAKPAKTAAGDSFIGRMIENAKSVNRLFLVAAAVLIAASMGLYVWANFVVSDSVTSTGVKVVDVENSFYKEYIGKARISGETFYGQLIPMWERLPKEKKLEFLQKVYQAGAERGYTQVNLITKDGKPAAFASPTRMEITSQ